MPKIRAVNQEGEIKAISLSPCVCKTPMGSSMVPVPYMVSYNYASAQNVSPNVDFRGTPALRSDGYLPTVVGNEAGVGGGVKSGVNKGFVNMVEHSKSVTINGLGIVRHGDKVDMNCATPNPNKGKTRKPQIKEEELKHDREPKKIKHTFRVGIISWINPFNTDRMFRDLDYSQIQKPVSLIALRAAIEPLSNSSNTTTPPNFMFKPEKFSGYETRGFLFVDFEISGEAPDNLVLTYKQPIDNPGYTPGGKPKDRDHYTPATPKRTYTRAQKGSLDIKDLTEKQLKKINHEGQQVVMVTSHARLAGLKGLVGAQTSGLGDPLGGVPYISRRIAVTLDTKNQAIRILWGGSPFPSHKIYLRGANVGHRIQSKPETLLFGKGGEKIKPLPIKVTEWIPLNYFVPDF